MARHWAFVLADEQGVAARELDTATGRTVRFMRNQAASVALALDLEDEAAADVNRILGNGLPRLRVYVDGGLVFYGPWAPMREASGVDQGEGMALAFRSPFYRYESAPTGRTTAPWAYTAEDQGEIALDMIDQVNAQSALGLGRGTVEATVNRDRSYADKMVAEAIRELSAVQGGFDFSETFTHDEGDPDTLALLNIHAQLGDDRTGAAIFEHGAGTLENVASVTRQTFPPLNAVRVLGQDGAYGFALDQDSIDRYGLIQAVLSASDGTVEQATLDAKASEALRPDPVRLVEFQPDPELAPMPLRDYFVGDTVTVRAREGALDLDEAVRVNGFEIDLDDDGGEAAHRIVYEGV